MDCAVSSSVCDRDGFGRNAGDGGVPSGRNRRGRRPDGRAGKNAVATVYVTAVFARSFLADGRKSGDRAADPVCSDLQIYDGDGALTVVPTERPVAHSTVFSGR